MAEKKLVEAITSMEEDFAQWYTDVVKKAELTEYSSIRGCMVIRPYGYALWENIQTALDGIFKETGVENVYMPMFIPESLLQKEKDLVGMYLSSHPLDRYDFEISHFTNCPLAEIQDRVAECESGKKTTAITAAGIVTDVKQLTTKAGKPFSKTILEDYSGSYELALFGKDHEAFLQYMKPLQTLYLEGEIGEKWTLKAEERAQGKTAPYTFKVKKISLLGNVSDEMLSGFSLDLETPMLTPEFRKELVKVLKKHKGNLPLTIYLTDLETHYRIQFYSKKFQVAVTTEFIQDLRRIGLEKYDVVRK